MSSPRSQPLLATSRGELRFGQEPWLMGVVNATPDSFSDGGLHRTAEERFALARTLVGAGARMIDVGGESGVTDRPAVSAQTEIERVVPLIRRIVSELEVIVSVDTYKPEVAEAAVAAGASIVNDTSGLRDPGLADVAAATGAALVIMHTRAAPKQKLLDPSLDGKVLADVESFLNERIAFACERGVAFEQLLLDPGPDFGKTPAQTVAALRSLGRLHALGRPLLLAVSRKDFVGAITGRPPRERLAGTLAAIGHGAEEGVHVIRAHDVAAARDFLAVRAVLCGEQDLESGLRLAEELRRDRTPAGGRPGPPLD